MLALPIAPADALTHIIVAAFCTLPAGMDSPQARLMSLATAIQETDLATRVQIEGPARGLWQSQLNFVADVLNNRAADDTLYAYCLQAGATYGTHAIYNTLEADDELACVVNRLGFWCDPRPLPALGDMLGAWDCYERVQRPGRPSYTRWKTHSYPLALETINAAQVSAGQ